MNNIITQNIEKGNKNEKRYLPHIQIGRKKETQLLTKKENTCIIL